jgi:hypothetical protein
LIKSGLLSCSADFSPDFLYVFLCFNSLFTFQDGRSFISLFLPPHNIIFFSEGVPFEGISFNSDGAK